MTFTFKTSRESGRYSSFFPYQHNVKVNHKCVGSISDEAPHKVRLMVEKTDKDKLNDKNPNCPWKWITIKKEFTTIDEAKKWLKENYELITSTFTLHSQD